MSGRATRLVLRDVGPDHFGHLTAVNALSRPGPLFSGQTADYCEVRWGRAEPERLHPLVDMVTADTYGQIIYQEQILQILKELGGFDWFSVSQIRRIISKKMGEAAFQMSYQQFADGAASLHGIPGELADRIWKRLVTSGTYSFNIAHAISYTMLAFWTAWLKAHYPLEFYAASLAKANKETQFVLMRDALAHSIDIRPPSLEHSGITWKPVDGAIIAGWQQFPKVGPTMAPRISAAANGGFTSWKQLEAIPGIGEKTTARMEAFTLERDPFGLYRTEKRLASVHRWLRRQKDVPLPTHDGDSLTAMHVEPWKPGTRWKPGPRVVYFGMVKRVEYKDIVEDERSRTGREVEDILKDLKWPHLVKRATLHMFDTGDEEVYARIHRRDFPRLRKELERIHVNHDVVVVAGNRKAGFGTPITAKQLWVIDPD